jgi:TonB family protein
MAGAMAMKMEMHMWAATKEELERVPALKELAAYLSAQAAGADPSSVANKMFAGIPGVGDKLKAPMDAMMKASSQAILRTEIKMVMPGSAKMMGATNPEEPFTDMTTDLVELSTNPIPDSVFQVPAGFQEAKLEELVGMLAPGRPQAPQQDPVPPEELAAARVGGYPAGVTAPVLVRKFEAEYTEEARRAKYHAVVILAATVNPQGVPENIRVRRAVGLGLDEKAIEAVKLWQFRPAVKEGIPVAMDVTIEVAFHE